MIRTQLYLEETLHRRLRDLARRQDTTISELVRQALARVYGQADQTDLLATLKGIAGLWRERDDLGPTDAYVRRLRRSTRRSRHLR